MVNRTTLKQNIKEFGADYIVDQITDRMIEFAKMHTEQAVKAISENVKIKYKDSEYGLIDRKAIVSKKSILNAYPIDLIK